MTSVSKVITRFANPYKQCASCREWVDGARVVPGQLTLVPCGHEADYVDVCPSWSPDDGCTCVERGIMHDYREPPFIDDGRTY